MQTITAGFLAVVLVIVYVFTAVILGTLMGVFAGWIIGLFFADTILGIAAQLGLTGISMWQLGAFLGFVGGFFRTNLHRQG